MATKTLPPPGVYVPVPTFFDTLASYVHTPPLDIEAQCAHALHLARSGITGLLLLGSTGEAVALTDDERGRVIHAVRQALDAAGFTQYPLMAGTAAYTIDATIQQCTAARQAGADYAMCLAPGFFAGQTTTDGMAAWFEAVATASPLPVLIYNYPGVTNQLTLAPALYVRLAAHPNIVGAKLSHGDLALLAQVTGNGASSPTAPDRFRVYTGLGQQLAPALAVGAAGAIDGLAGIFPHVVVRLYAAWRQRAQADAAHAAALTQALYELQADVARGELLVVRWGTMGIKAAIARERGFGQEDGTRLPLVGKLPETAWSEFEDALVKLRKLEQMLTDHRKHVEQKE